MNWQTFGHTRNKKIFETFLLTNNIVGSYLFVGPSGIGKAFFAKELASKILNIQNLYRHPDFKLHNADSGGVEEIRGLIEWLTQKPFVARCKIALIDNAEGLNLESSNALLKSIEESRENTLIFLISSQKLLPTIESRCQVFYFHKLPVAELEAYSAEKKFSTNERLLDISFGSVSRLCALSDDQEYFTQENGLLAELERITQMSKGERLGLIGSYAEKDSSVLKELLQKWLLLVLNRLKNNPALYKMASQLTLSINDFNFNKNKKLILQNLFLNL